MRGFGWVGAGVVAMVVAAGCDGSTGVGSTGSPLTAGELEARLGEGATRVELKLGASGPSELHVQARTTEERVQGWVASLDVIEGEVELADIGFVSFAADARFRTESESRVELAAWAGEIEAALAAGQPVFVRATRLAGVAPQAADDAAFVATDLRIESDGDPKIELDVDADNYAVTPPTLLVLGQVYDLSSARLSDDDATHDLGDDNGNDGLETGDDNGNDGVEVEVEVETHGGEGPEGAEGPEGRG